MNNRDKVNRVQTYYWVNGTLRSYATKTETPMHQSLRDRHAAETRWMVVPADDILSLALIVRSSASAGWEEACEANRESRRVARLARKAAERSS